ncbi:hypothetical protein [Lysobacter sp. TAB13]|uniref:hypothetical protein n=1 Tax=Lysobacter sp. TAB13 TaxID=3233065 RepID=UPI003F9B3FA1
MTTLRIRAALSLAIASIAAPAAHAADFAACFSLKPGAAYEMDDSKIRVVRERFGDRDAIALVSSGSGVKTSTYYDPSGRALLGSVQYGIAALGGNAAAPVITERYTQTPEFPAKAKPGDKFKLRGAGKRTLHNDDSVEDLNYPGFSDFTFIGFEDLELSVDFTPRTFSGTCHLKAGDAEHSAEFWYAPGFGLIKFVRFQGKEAFFSQQLESITAE